MTHRPLTRLLPGLTLCAVVTALGYALAACERALLGKVWLEPLVLAILIGTAIRSAWTPGRIWGPGVEFGAKVLLELAVVLLGASVSAATLLGAGPWLLLGIGGVVALAICVSFAIGRGLGLPARMALLVACGTSICGNSAIAAVAPVIGADGDDVAASIGFTAVLGIVTVVALPLLGHALGMDGLHYGALAGLTVYAVPQVIAAAAPAGPLAVQMGTLVKLVRVLMLGPVCVALAMVAPRLPRNAAPARAPSLTRVVPWFILGFLALMGLRSADLVPAAALAPAADMAGLLTVLSMAALGLGVDVRVVAQAGARVTAAVCLSLVALGLISLALIHLIA